MSEIIHYAFGPSSLGGTFAAMSDAGVVAFEFGDDRAALLDRLQQRFPAAQLDEDSAGLAATLDQLAAVVDAPRRDPGLALDLRGTAWQLRVWEMLQNIPAGETTTYGEIAARLGMPLDARDATQAIAANPVAVLVPCHRVVKKNGTLSGYRWGFWRKRALLARERDAA
jgi:AraC family transcriptional regulator, regulatory protein of adaptative response / methylated-DNA-[protein]-cysteine methyltransferase